MYSKLAFASVWIPHSQHTGKHLALALQYCSAQLWQVCSGCGKLYAAMETITSSVSSYMAASVCCSARRSMKGRSSTELGPCGLGAAMAAVCQAPQATCVTFLSFKLSTCIPRTTPYSRCPPMNETRAVKLRRFYRSEFQILFEKISVSPKTYIKICRICSC